MPRKHEPMAYQGFPTYLHYVTKFNRNEGLARTVCKWSMERYLKAFWRIQFVPGDFVPEKDQKERLSTRPPLKLQF